MKALERLDLVNEISATLQEQMKTADINIFLRAFGIKDANNSSVSSKRVYAQSILSSVNSEILLRIASELKIDTSKLSTDGTTGIICTPDIWPPNKIKVFISHLASEKEKATRIQHYLLKKEYFGFVAHEDIEPSSDWMQTILNALNSMDFLVALITPGFHKSIYTNQEIGFALGKKVPIISVKIEEDPQGFISRAQAIEGKNRYPKDIVENIIGIYKKINLDNNVT